MYVLYWWRCSTYKIRCGMDGATKVQDTRHKMTAAARGSPTSAADIRPYSRNFRSLGTELGEVESQSI